MCIPLGNHHLQSPAILPIAIVIDSFLFNNFTHRRNHKEIWSADIHLLAGLEWLAHISDGLIDLAISPFCLYIQPHPTHGVKIFSMALLVKVQ